MACLEPASWHRFRFVGKCATKIYIQKPRMPYKIDDARWKRVTEDRVIILATNGAASDKVGIMITLGLIDSICNTMCIQFVLLCFVMVRLCHRVIKWKYFPYYWPFVIGIHRSPVDSHHQGPVIWNFHVSLMFICTNYLNKQPCWR